MNHNPSLFAKVDLETQRKRALAKVYDVLMKLAEEKEASDTAEDKEKPALLKSNIPLGQ